MFREIFTAWHNWFHIIDNQHIMSLLIASFLSTIVTLWLCFHFRRKLSFNKSEISVLLFLTVLVLWSVLSDFPFGGTVSRIGIVLSVFFLLKVIYGKIPTLFHSASTVMLWIGLAEILYATACSRNEATGIRGHFDNPAGFAAFLIMILPYCFLLIGSRNRYKRWTGLGILAVFVTGLILSESRAGIVSVLCVISIILYQRYRDFTRSKQSPKFRIGFLTASLILLTTIFTALYFQKKASANGRLLIWRASMELLREKPISGHGAGSFQALYMPSQAKFLGNHQDHPLSFLADNTKHPFNEYLGALIQYGILGFLALGCIALLFYKQIRAVHLSPVKRCALLSLTALAVFSLFSYPLYYYVILCLVGIDLFILSNQQHTSFGHVPIWILTLISIPVSSWAVFYTAKQLQMTSKWEICMKEYPHSTNRPAIISLYSELYLKKNFYDPLFLYNYGAVLNNESLYHQSIQVLNHCRKIYDDADVQIIQADNFYQIGNYQAAEQHAVQAAQMCPNRFLPLYYLWKIFQKNGRKQEAIAIAEVIVQKPIKVENIEIRKIKLIMQKFLLQENDS